MLVDTDSNGEDNGKLPTALCNKLQQLHPRRQVVNMSSTRYASIKRCCRKLGWIKFNTDKTSNQWDYAWIDTGGVHNQILSHMTSKQKVNHFPGMSQICQKCRLARTLQRVQDKVGENLYDFFPKTWCLPYELNLLKSWWETHRYQGNGAEAVILKPESGSQGKGIQVITSFKKLQRVINSYGKGEGNFAVQQYIERPLLLRGYKFDLRIYVLLTAVTPSMRAFVHSEGLVRLCTEKYQAPSTQNCENNFMHLTNYSINKNNYESELDARKELDKPRTPEQVLTSTESSKWALSGLWIELKKMFPEEKVDALWATIKDVIVKTLLSAKQSLAHEYTACFPDDKDGGFSCFELLGFDILIDSNLRPWLLEVNNSPSFHGDSRLDRLVKDQVITDSLILTGVTKDDLLKTVRNYEETQSTSSTTTASSHGTCYNLHDVRSEYEDSHLGGFQRVLPLSADCPFVNEIEQVAQGQHTFSVFREDAKTQRRREDALERTRQRQLAEEKIAAVTCRRPPWGSNGKSSTSENSTYSQVNEVSTKRSGIESSNERQPVMEVSKRILALAKPRKQICKVVQSESNYKWVTLEQHRLYQFPVGPNNASGLSPSRVERSPAVGARVERSPAVGATGSTWFASKTSHHFQFSPEKPSATNSFTSFPSSRPSSFGFGARKLSRQAHVTNSRTQRKHNQESVNVTSTTTTMPWISTPFT